MRRPKTPIVLAICFLAIACPWPITTCACTPPITRAIVAGSVSRPNEVPAPGAHLVATARRDGCSDPSRVSFFNGDITQADDQGMYRMELSATEVSDSACITITAYGSGLYSSDSAVVTGVRVRLRSSTSPDSVRVDIEIP